MKCSKHNVEMDMETTCHVCHGDGETIDHDDYSNDPGMVCCWNCRGSGHGLDDCWLCYEEEIEA